MKTHDRRAAASASIIYGGSNHYHRDASELAAAAGTLSTSNKSRAFSARGDAAPTPNTAGSEALVRAGDRAIDLRNAPIQFEKGDAVSRLPEGAARKLRRLRAASEDLNAAIRDVSDRVHLASQARTAARIQIDELTAKFGQIPHHPSMKQAVARRDAVAGDVAELEQRLTALRAKRQPELRRLENYVSGLPADAQPHTDHVELPKIGKGVIPEALQAVRDTIARLGTDIHAAECAAHPSSDVKRRMVEQIEALADRGAPNVANAIEAGLPIAFPQVDIRAQLTGFALSEGTPKLTGWAAHSAPDALSLIAWMFKNQLTAALSEEIDLLADDETALDDEARAAKIESLQAAKLEAERVEERIIELAAEEGRALDRRPNADPRAILGLSSALPAPR